MAIDKILDSTLPKDLLTTYGFEPTLPSVDETASIHNNFYHSNYHGSTDSLLETLDSRPKGPPAQRKQPDFIHKIPDEESSLLGGEHEAGGNPEEKAKIV